MNTGKPGSLCMPRQPKRVGVRRQRYPVSPLPYVAVVVNWSTKTPSDSVRSHRLCLHQNRLSGRLMFPKFPIPFSENEKVKRRSVRSPRSKCWYCKEMPQHSQT